MPSPSPAADNVAAIRTLALVGPAAAGKTSLAEALLHRAGAIAAPIKPPAAAWKSKALSKISAITEGTADKLVAIT